MATKTVLTDEQINKAWSNNLTGTLMSSDPIKTFARAIEQAVLQSADVQSLKRDKERLDWLADPKNNLGNVQLPTECVERNPHSLRDAIDDAMETMI